MSLSSRGPEKVNVSVKTKWLWFTIGLLLVLLALSPVVASYLPSSPTSQSAPSSGSSTQPNCANPCTIIIKNSLFGPTQPTIVKTGTTVTWSNKDDTIHTTTSNTGLWDSGVLAVGKSFSFTFSTPGVFDYHCNVHPMTGEIVVVS